jgi:hypothetical protein
MVLAAGSFAMEVWTAADEQQPKGRWNVPGEAF